MSGSSCALLVYGVDLGSGEDLFTGFEAEDGVRPETVVWRQLAGSLPPEQVPTQESGDDLEGAVSRHLGLTVEWHGSIDDESMLLAIEVEADIANGETTTIHPDQMLIRAEQGKYHERIVDALRIIGVDPDAYTIGWTVASYHSTD